MFVESTMFYLYGFAKLFDCPIISVSAVTCHPKVYERVGNNEAGVILENSHPNSEKTLFSRIIDALSYFIKYYFEHAEYKQTNVVLQKYFGNDYNLNELMERVSMVFENTDNVLYPVRPMIPTVVQIGGINLFNEVPDLPKSLERTLDAASQGFIYLSLGTVLSDSDRIPTKVFLEVFKNLPYTVLWKHNNDLKDLPENVHVSNWFPQRNVLKHKNIKLFLMQGGANSLLEAIHCEVPLIAMPFFFDQFRNSRLIEHYGVGARLNFTKLNAKVFEEKIIEVAENPRYKQNIIKLKKLIDDEPLSGLDKAVFWTEYVIRHNGTKHLRSPVLDIPFYQYYLLDVIGVFVVVFILVLYVSILILKMIRAVLCSMLQKKLKTN
ncbi:hypothetical protein FQR65_LT07893 [Abscondita terminalis]|nr:hypothetical protein FQR65_LT07893 [Abscondita terminalis]